MCWNSHALHNVCSSWWNVCCVRCWSCVTREPGDCVDAAKLLANWGPGTAWSLLQPANAFSQPPPPCLFSLPCSSSLSLSYPFFPKLSFFFHELWLSPSPNPLPLPQVLTTLLHCALFFLSALSHVHMHLRTCTCAHTHKHTHTLKLWQLPQQCATSPTLQWGSVQVPLACPDPHLDIALSMLTAKSWRHSCHS